MRLMNPLRVVGRALESLWSAIDPDEPMFCECEPMAACADCALAAPVEPILDWAPSAAFPA